MAGKVTRRVFIKQGMFLAGGVLGGMGLRPATTDADAKPDIFVADINLVRKPDLCVMDATEVLATGGPRGPGQVKRPHKVFAGHDPVAVDTYATWLLGVDPKRILMLDYASRHDLGRNDLSKVRIKEIII